VNGIRQKQQHHMPANINQRKGTQQYLTHAVGERILTCRRRRSVSRSLSREKSVRRAGDHASTGLTACCNTTPREIRKILLKPGTAWLSVGLRHRIGRRTSGGSLDRWKGSAQKERKLRARGGIPTTTGYTVRGET